jgi:hypothetical protein
MVLKLVPCVRHTEAGWSEAAWVDIPDSRVPDGLTPLRDDPPPSDAQLNESDGVLGRRAEPRRGGVQGPRMLEVLLVGGQ